MANTPEQDQHDSNVHQYLYHLRELNKLHAKMLEDHGRDIQAMKTDIAVMRSKMDNFRIENVEQVILNKPQSTGKELAQTGSIGGVIAAIILGVVQGLWQWWKAA